MAAGTVDDMQANGRHDGSLVVDGVAKVFYPRTGDKEVVALQDAHLELRHGEFVCLVGPSGCGKTTLLKTIGGLIRPTRGRVLIDGEQVDGPGFDRAMVFQNASLLPWRSVRRNIAYGLQLKNVDRKQISEIVPRLVELVGLSGFEDALPSELSGGMQQRVNVARALAVDPNTLLMDEPFAALDAQTREMMQDELLRIWRERQRSVIFVTHQIDEAVYLADRVAVMAARPGRILEVVDVPFERPREFGLKRSREFQDLVGYIWSKIETQARESAMT